MDLGELGQTLQKRMTRFKFRLQDFNDEYTVQQAPTSPFKVPIEEDKIAILAVSERYPTYYDLCVADAACHTTCYEGKAKYTFTGNGMTHSGDINEDHNLLHHIKVSRHLESGKEFAVFVSGYRCKSSSSRSIIISLVTLDLRPYKCPRDCWNSLPPIY